MKKNLLLGVVLSAILVLAAGPVLAQATSVGEDKGIEAQAAAAPAPPAGHNFRYVLPHYNSQNSAAGSRSVTILSVYNQTTKDCEVGVQFQHLTDTNSCTMSATVPAGTSRVFCSRFVNDPIVPCIVTCSPELTFDSGHASVSSNKACVNIAVDAQVVYTSDGDDNLVTAIRPLTLVKPNKANLGD